MSTTFDFDDEDDGFNCRSKGLGMKPTLSRKHSSSSSLSAASSLSSKDGISRKLSSKSLPNKSSKNATSNQTQTQQQEEEAVVVTMDMVEKGESQAKNDELEYLLDGLHSGGGTMRMSIVKLVDACGSPHARFMLRLSGCLPKLLDAVEVAKHVKMEDQSTRMYLAIIAFTLLQDRANLEYASFSCVCGLAALLAPLQAQSAPSQSTRSEVGATKEVKSLLKQSTSLKRDNSGWRKKHKFGGSDTLTSQHSLNQKVEVTPEKQLLFLRGKVSPYEAEGIDAAHLSLLTLVHLMGTCSNTKASTVSPEDGNSDLKSPNVSTGFRQYRSKSQSPLMMKRTSDKQGWQDPSYLLGEKLRQSGALFSLANIVCDEVSNAISNKDSSVKVAKEKSTQDHLSVWSWKLLHCLQLLEFSASQSEQNQICLSQDQPHAAMVEKDHSESNYNISPNTFLKKSEKRNECCNVIPSLVELIRVCYEYLHELTPHKVHDDKQLPPSMGPSHREILACSFKVLINLTHHHRVGVSSLVNYNLLPIVMCVLFHHKQVSSSSKEELIPAHTDEKEALASSQMSDVSSVNSNNNHFEENDITPQKKSSSGEGTEGLSLISGDVPHFDLLLLSLTVLTNCAEISAVSRNILYEVHIQQLDEESFEVTSQSNERNYPSKRDQQSEVKIHDFVSFMCLLLRQSLANFESELEQELNHKYLNSKIEDASQVGNQVTEKGEDIIDQEVDISTSLAKKKATDISDESGWNVEELVVSSYFALLLGCLIRENPHSRKVVDLKLSLQYDTSNFAWEDDLFLDGSAASQDVQSLDVSNGGVQVLVRVLTAFVALQSSAGVLTEMSLAPVLALIDELSGNQLLKTIPSVSSQGDSGEELRARTLPPSLKLSQPPEFQSSSSSTVSSQQTVPIKKTYGSSKARATEISTSQHAEISTGLQAFDLFEEVSESNSGLSRAKTWPSPKKEDKEIASLKSNTGLLSTKQSLKALSKPIPDRNMENDVQQNTSKEEELKRRNASGDVTLKKRSRIKLVKYVSPVRCDSVEESEVDTSCAVSSSLTRASASSTTTTTTTKLSQKRSLSLNKSQTIARDGRNSREDVTSSTTSVTVSSRLTSSSSLVTSVEFVVGDHVKVSERTQPGLNKPGGVGRVTRVHRSSFDNSLVYDVKYVLGGSERSLSSKLLQPYTVEDGDSNVLSRSSSSSSARRGGRSQYCTKSSESGRVKKIEDGEEDDIFGDSQELSLIGIKESSRIKSVDKVASRSRSDSSTGSTESSQVILSNKRKKKM